MRRLLPLLLLLVATAAIAATEANDQSPLRGQLKGTLPGYMYEPDSTMRVGRANQYGHQYVSEGLKDRDHWEFKSTGYQSDSINAAGWAKFGIINGGGLSFADLKDYNSASLMVSWAANADTDSVAIEIFPIGKQSASDDGYDYVFDVDDSDSLMTGLYVWRGDWGNRLWTSNPGRLPARRYTPKWNGAQASLSWMASGALVPQTYSYSMGQLSGYGVVIPLTDIAGSDVQIPIAGFWVRNLHPRRPLVGLNINIWAKVK